MQVPADALHLNPGGRVQPAQMQDGAVELTQTQCLWEAGPVFFTDGEVGLLLFLRDTAGGWGPGRERRSTECAWPTAPQILAPAP